MIYSVAEPIMLTDLNAKRLETPPTSNVAQLLAPDLLGNFTTSDQGMNNFITFINRFTRN